MSGDRNSKLYSGLLFNVLLVDALGSGSQTYQPPMLASRKSYWETVSRPYENGWLSHCQPAKVQSLTIK
jgi:hypothetical protein